MGTAPHRSTIDSNSSAARGLSREQVNPANLEALWVLRAQAGDRDALRLLLEAVQPSLRRFARGILRNAQEAEDVVQEALLLVYRRLGQLTHPELLRPWAFRIVKRLALRRLVRLKREFDRAGEEGELDAHPAAPERPAGASIEALLERGEVSPASRGVLVLHFQEGLTLPEIAAALELPLGTVKSRLGYGLAVLRRRLDGQEGSR